jgi:hypothetical protein
MGDFLGLSSKDFLRRYVTREGDHLVLKDGARGECVFYDWDTSRCRVYPLRPAQCRTYPFWLRILKSRGDWEREGVFCPGIGEGKEHAGGWIDSVMLEERPVPLVSGTAQGDKGRENVFSKNTQ